MNPSLPNLVWKINTFAVPNLNCSERVQSRYIPKLFKNPCLPAKVPNNKEHCYKFSSFKKIKKNGENGREN